jgi:hypothetical protein
LVVVAGHRSLADRRRGWLTAPALGAPLGPVERRIGRLHRVARTGGGRFPGGSLGGRFRGGLLGWRGRGGAGSAA